MIDDHEFEPGSRRGRCGYLADIQAYPCHRKRAEHLAGPLAGWRAWWWRRAVTTPQAAAYAAARRRADEATIAEYGAGTTSMALLQLGAEAWEAGGRISELRRVTIDGLVRYQLGYWHRMHTIARQRRQAAGR